MCYIASTPTMHYFPRLLTSEQHEQLAMLLKLLASSDVDSAIEEYYLNRGEGEAPKTPIDQQMYDQMAHEVEERYSLDCCCESGNIWNEAYNEVVDSVYDRLDGLRQRERDAEAFTVPEVSREEREVYARVRAAKVYECIDRCCSEQGLRKPNQLEADRIANAVLESGSNVDDKSDLTSRIAEALEKFEAA